MQVLWSTPHQSCISCQHEERRKGRVAQGLGHGGMSLAEGRAGSLGWPRHARHFSLALFTIPSCSPAIVFSAACTSTWSSAILWDGLVRDVLIVSDLNHTLYYTYFT